MYTFLCIYQRFSVHQDTLWWCLIKVRRSFVILSDRNIELETQSGSSFGLCTFGSYSHPVTESIESIPPLNLKANPGLQTSSIPANKACGS